MGGEESKKQILKSTGILGSAQLINIIVGIIRVKVLAILLGATGVGIAGLYQTTIDLIRSVTGFGIGYSAVRDIAASVATKDERKVAIAITVLRKWSWATGILAMFVTVIFSKQLSFMAFGNKDHAIGIATLSVGLLIAAISSGQSALLQGFRMIGDMAKANVLGAIIGLILAVAIYYFLGIKGIVPALLVAYLLNLLINWYFSRRITILSINLSSTEIFKKGSSMAKLGFFMTIAGLSGTCTMFLIRSFLMKQDGLTTVGHFVAAWSISSMYISAIFNAMGADFFPRLSGVQHDSDSVTKLVNEQLEVAILISAPIIIGMISFIDVVVHIFYSKDFGPTAEILNWQLLGDFFRVLGWPIGLIILAKGRGGIFICTEICWNLLFFLGVYFGWDLFGIQITGIAFLASYILYALLLYAISRKLVLFTLSYKVKRAILVFLSLLVLSFLSVSYFAQDLRYAVCSMLTLIACIYSIKGLKEIINIMGLLKRLGVSK
jgi:O-antigen/teichoic acid export membrane protein